jgi:hypothetical protein
MNAIAMAERRRGGVSILGSVRFARVERCPAGKPRSISRGTLRIPVPDLYHQVKTNLAAAEYEDTLRNGPGDAWAHYTRARDYEAVCSFGEAAREYQKAATGVVRPRINTTSAGRGLGLRVLNVRSRR